MDQFRIAGVLNWLGVSHIEAEEIAIKILRMKRYKREVLGELVRIVRASDKYIQSRSAKAALKFSRSTIALVGRHSGADEKTLS